MHNTATAIVRIPAPDGTVAAQDFSNSDAAQVTRSKTSDPKLDSKGNLQTENDAPNSDFFPGISPVSAAASASHAYHSTTQLTESLIGENTRTSVR